MAAKRVSNSARADRSCAIEATATDIGLLREIVRRLPPAHRTSASGWLLTLDEFWRQSANRGSEPRSTTAMTSAAWQFFLDLDRFQ